MRVSVLTPYTEPHLGGITSYAREIALGYRDLGLEVRGLAAEGVTNNLFTVLDRNKILFALRAFLILLRWKPDFVHSHSHWHLLLPGVLLRLLRRRTRLIFTFHTPWESSRHTLRFGALAFLLRFPTVVTFASQEMRRSLKLPRSIRQGVVYPAPERFVARYRTSQHGQRPPAILYIGPMIWPEKVAGIKLLLEAFADVEPANPDWRLRIVGDGPLKKEIERTAEHLGLQRVVTMKGWVGDPGAELATADIYAQITLQEGLPLSLLNAMAMGLPVVATSVGGIPELISDSVNGYLVPPSRDLISHALSTLMNDEGLRIHMGREAQKSVINRDWKNVAKDYLSAVEAASG